MKKSGIELLPFGVKIDWDSHHTAKNPSAKRNYQRLIRVTCANCKKWRWINSCALWEYRKGKKKFCWECHKKRLALSNSTGAIGRHKNSSGYIIRTLASFDSQELQIIKPMLRSPSKQRRKNHTEILEHRAVMALSLKRPLKNNEIVHHINGIRDDNRIENLEVHTAGTHSRLYNELLYENRLLKKELQEIKQQLDLVLNT